MDGGRWVHHAHAAWLLNEPWLGFCHAACPGEGAKHLHEDHATPSSGAKGQPDAVSRLIGKLFGNSYASDAPSASHSGTSSYTYSPASSCGSSSQYFHLGCEASAHDLCPGLRGGASCVCSCWHGDRCVSFPIFSASTSWFQNDADKCPCDLYFLCSRCIHTKGIYFWR